MIDQLYRIVDEKRYLAIANVPEWLVPVNPIKRFSKYDIYLREPPASMSNVDGVTWGVDDEDDEYTEVAVVPHVERADDE